MSLLSPPGAPLRKAPFAGSGAFPLSIDAMLEECVSVCEGVEDRASRLRVEDVVSGGSKMRYWRMRVRMELYR